MRPTVCNSKSSQKRELRVLVVNPDYYVISGVTKMLKALALSQTRIAWSFCGCNHSGRPEDPFFDRQFRARLLSLNPANVIAALFTISELAYVIGAEVVFVQQRRVAVLLNFFRVTRAPVVYTGQILYPFDLAFRLERPLYAVAITKSVAENFFVCTERRVGCLISNPAIGPRKSSNELNAARYRPFILSVGRLDRMKGFDFLIAVWAIACREIAGVDLVIAGDGVLRKSLEDLARALGVSDRIVFLGFVEDCGPLYSSCLFHALFSRFEGQGIVVLEAALHGVASLVTDVPGLRDCLPESRTLPNGIRFGDTEMGARAVINWVRDPGSVATDGKLFADFHRDSSDPELVGERYRSTFLSTKAHFDGAVI